MVAVWHHSNPVLHILSPQVLIDPTDIMGLPMTHFEEIQIRKHHHRSYQWDADLWRHTPASWNVYFINNHGLKSGHSLVIDHGQRIDNIVNQQHTWWGC